MRSVLLIALFAAAAGAYAQQGRPPKLEPLPDVPPPTVREPSDEPSVRIAPQDGDKVEEVREAGRVVMIKVTPPGGEPYYLIDNTGNGIWMRRESLDPGVRVPMWTIRTFN
jgi:hypothetical protein